MPSTPRWAGSHYSAGSSWRSEELKTYCLNPLIRTTSLVVALVRIALACSRATVEPVDPASGGISQLFRRNHNQPACSRCSRHLRACRCTQARVDSSSQPIVTNPSAFVCVTQLIILHFDSSHDC